MLGRGDGGYDKQFQVKECSFYLELIYFALMMKEGRNVRNRGSKSHTGNT